MKYNTWLPFTKDTELKTNDLLLIKHGKEVELAFVDSGLYHEAPSRISSMPEGWSYDISEEYLPKLVSIYPSSGSANKDNCAVVLGTTRLKNCDGEYVFSVYKYMRVRIDVKP